MEYQKIINLPNNPTNQATTFRARNWVEMNDGSYGVYSTGTQIKF